MKSFNFISRHFQGFFLGVILLGSFAFGQEEPSTRPAADQDQPASPLKVAVVVQDSTGLRFDAAYFGNDQSPAGEKLDFMVGDSTDCADDDVDCYLSEAQKHAANYLMLLNLIDNQVVLYDPATREKLAESSLDKDNPFGVFESLFNSIATATPADSVRVDSSAMTSMMPDSTLIDRVSAAMDSLAAEALAAAQSAATMHQETEAEPVLPVSTPTEFTDFDKVFYRHLRSFDAFIENPSYLALDHEMGSAWSIAIPMPFVPLQVRMNNSALTPGWIKDWFQGQFLTESDKQQMTSILRGKSLDIRTVVDIPTVLGVRIGSIGFNTGVRVAVNGVLPGDLLMLPWSNFTGDNPLTNLDLNFEMLNYSQTNIGYGREIPTPFGNVRAGAGIGLYLGFGYAQVQSEQFTLATNTDSIVVDLAARGFYTDPNIGLLSSPNFNNLELGNLPSALGFGLNFGAGMDLYHLTGQHLDVQMALSNLGAKLNWSQVTEKTLTAHAVIYDVAAVMDSSSNNDAYIDSLLNPTDVVVGVGSHSVSIPAQFALMAQYQPLRQILVEVSYRQSFSNGAAWTTDPQIGLYVGYFPIPAIELRGALNSFAGQTTWSGGFGVHLRRYEMGLDVTAMNGFGSNASGAGVRMTQSLYF